MSKETLWNGLLDLGFSAKAAAVIMGHAQAESGNETNRLQGDFSKSRTASVYYTAQVDNGVISRKDFAYNAPNGGGYGWLQWTYPPRKEGLYDTAKELGVSIGSEKAALTWLWRELHQAEYIIVLDALEGKGTIREMSDVFMHRFERPADQSEAACAQRAAMCQAMYDLYATQESPQEAAKAPEADTPTTPFWPPRTLAEGMLGADVAVLQALLQARGYNCHGITGEFNNKTKTMVLAFQAENNLASDGIAGINTWSTILNR